MKGGGEKGTKRRGEREEEGTEGEGEEEGRERKEGRRGGRREGGGKGAGEKEVKRQLSPSISQPHINSREESQVNVYLHPLGFQESPAGSLTAAWGVASLCSAPARRPGSCSVRSSG